MPDKIFRRTFELWHSPEATAAALAAMIAGEAEASVQDLIRIGLSPPTFRKFVDGVEDAPNTAIRLDGTGLIDYQFSSMALVAGFALNYAINASPERSGAYKRAWFLLVNKQLWTDSDLTAIPLGAEVTLSNHADYHRKIDVGGMIMRVPPHIVEQTRQAVLRKFATVVCDIKFLTRTGGYILKGRGQRSGLSYDKKTKQYRQRRPARPSDEPDRQKGAQMTYPSLIMHEPI